MPRSSYRKRKRSSLSGTPYAKRMYRRSLAKTQQTAFRKSYAYRNQRTGGVLGIETKFWDTAKTAGALTATGNATGGNHDPSITECLNSVAQGNGAQQREGSVMSMKSIFVNGSIRWAALTNQNTAHNIGNVFVALVLDTQTNGSITVSENIYKNESGQGELAIAPLRNISNTDRYKVLRMKIIQAPVLPISYDGTNMEVQGGSVPFTLSYNLAGMKCKFKTDSTDGTVGTMRDNSLHIIAWTNNSSVAQTIYYNSRLRFVG